MRDPKPYDNVFPDELLSIHISDICQGFSFNPFSEIVRVDQQIFLVFCCLGKRLDNIQALLSKRPRAGQRIKNPSWLVYVRRKSLALVALLHIFLCLLLHVGPLIALCDGLMR